MNNKKIVSIIAAWNEQRMIGLSIASTKDIVYEYIVILKKDTYDHTKEVLKYCKKLWDLNMIIIESDLKLRDARKYAVEISKEYADYYLIQDGDEIYTNTDKILELIKNNYTFCYTSMIFLDKDLVHTLKDMTWLICHPFLFKNTEGIIWPNVGDLPEYDPNKSYHKIFTTGEMKNPFKFDCKIKDFRRIFLRDVFTQWHDGNFNGTIEEYADKYHHTILWYRSNIDNNLSLDEIINRYEEHESKEDKFRWNKIYNEEEYVNYPKVIKQFIHFNKLEGIKDLSDLEFLNKLN